MPLQEHRLIAISTPLGEEELAFYRAEITEALGEPFKIVVEMVSDNDAVSLDDLLGQNVTIRLETETDETRYFNGFITEFYQLPGKRSHSHYGAVIQPWLWLLNLSENCRIFQEKSYPDIIKDVFQQLGFSDFEDKLTGTYSAIDYVVQFNESDFNFVSRLMEQEGIFYYFDHTNGKHTMVLVDDNATLTEIGDIPYYPPEEMQRQYHSEVIVHWENYKRVRTAGVRLIDFDFEVPTKNLESVSSDPSTPSLSALEKFSYPGKYTERNDGNKYTRLLMERENSTYETKRAESNARIVCAGTRFSLTEHPRDDQNKEYLICRANFVLNSDSYVSDQSLNEDNVYQAHFTAIPAAIPYRPDAKARKPLMQGPQTAMVVGPSGEEIWTDKYGRVKVLFHWDRYAAADEKSSCWIRVSQAWAGKNWGHYQIPRIGQEVLVEFLGGDPDRPIIIGNIYNGSTMPPYELPANATRSGFKTRSSKGGGGFNEFRIEDKKGSEQIFIHAERNKDLRIKNDQFEWIGNESHQIIKGERFELVDKDKHQTLKANEMKEVEKDAHLNIKGSFFTDIGKDFHASYGGKYKVSVKADTSWKDGNNFSHKVGMTYSLDAGMEIHSKAGMTTAMEAGTTFHIKSGASVVIEGGAQVSLKVGGSFVSISPAGVQISGPMVMINSGGAAGSGPGSKPKAPSAPKAVKAPKEAKEADDDKAGGATTVAAKSANPSKLNLNSVNVGNYKPGKEPPPPVAQAVAAAQAQKQEEPDCKFIKMDIQCGHGRGGDIPTNTLEIVPDATKQKKTETTIQTPGSKVGSASYSKTIKFAGEESLSANITLENDCGTGKTKLSGHGDWNAGNSKSYTLKAEPLTSTDNLDKESPKVMSLEGKCDHGSKSVTIKQYPSEQVSAEVSLEFISAKMDKFNKAWEQWGSKFMGLTPVDLKPKLNPPKGSLTYEKGWKENSDWRAYYLVKYEAGLNPICGIEIEALLSITKLAGTLVGIPPAMGEFAASHIADILFRLGAGVELKASGSINNKYFSTGEAIASGHINMGVEGKVWVGITARLGSDYIASVSATGKLELKPYGGGEVSVDKTGIYVQIGVKLPPATASVTVEARAFYIFSRKKEKQWALWKKEHAIESKKYQLV